MNVALLATMLAFGGSLAGFGLTAWTPGAPSSDRAAARPSPALMQDVVVRGTDRHCLKAEVARRT